MILENADGWKAALMRIQILAVSLVYFILMVFSDETYRCSSKAIHLTFKGAVKLEQNVTDSSSGVLWKHWPWA